MRFICIVVDIMSTIPSRLKVLDFLASRKPMSRGDIATGCNIPIRTVSGAIHSLKENGMIRVIDSLRDTRRKRWMITDKGEIYLRKMRGDPSVTGTENQTT